MSPDVHGRIPHPEHIKMFAAANRWQERKDELLARASAIMEQQLVDDQVAMWKRQAENAKEVGIDAFKYLKAEGFDSSASAIAAIKWAQEEERKTRGAEKFITLIKDSSNDEVLETVRRLLTRKASTEETEGDVIDIPTGDAEP